MGYLFIQLVELKKNNLPNNCLKHLRFKVWNYNGENKFTYQMPANNELWRVEWQPGLYPQKTVVKKVAAVVKEESKF